MESVPKSLMETLKMLTPNFETFKIPNHLCVEIFHNIMKYSTKTKQIIAFVKFDENYFKI